MPSLSHATPTQLTQSACTTLPSPSSEPCAGSSTKGKFPYADLINAPLIRSYTSSMYDDYKPSTAEWMDLLSIANAYEMMRVYHHVIARVEDIDDPISRVLLAKKLNIKRWLAPAYVALCTRTDPINASEAEKLGFDSFVTLVTARESVYRDFQRSMNAYNLTLSISRNLRCCGNELSQLHDGANGAKMCPTCQQMVIPGPVLQPAFTNNNRRCCNQQPSQWKLGINGSRFCPSCSGIVLPAVVTANLKCCGNSPYQFIDCSNGAKICPSCRQIVIPGPGEAQFTNNNRRCCDNRPLMWSSHPDGSQTCPTCKGIVLPCGRISEYERALVLVKRIFDLED